ncbi:MAG: transcriptional coactivator p15/PC4 family protein [Candidatus Omnitrophica bacterium]|nr:transcriptional coactivator p15/PC4 family protein [Candidatus Omnitrophota bacterium]
MEDEQTHLIYSFPKSADECVQIVISQYKGNQYIDLRVWFQSGADGALKPTKRGVFLPIDYLSELKKGVDLLCKTAQKLKEEAPATA